MVQRFNGAALGLGITLLPIAALACAHLLLVPYTLATVHMFDPSIDPRMVPAIRSGLMRDYAIIALIVAAYWLLVATLGRGQFLRIRSANITLALSVFTFACAAIIGFTVREPASLFKGVCPILGLSDEVPGFGFDIRSPCQDFVGQAAPFVLLGVPLVLIVTSAILRIVVSRRRFPPLSAGENAGMREPNR